MAGERSRVVLFGTAFGKQSTFSRSTSARHFREPSAILGNTLEAREFRTLHSDFASGQSNPRKLLIINQCWLLPPMRKRSGDRKGSEFNPFPAFKDHITSAVANNQVVLIAGETGCGKITQVPQYVLDHMWKQGRPCKILCTQPR